MERRAFLKGTLAAAAAVPAVAIAPRLPSTLGGLIASWNENHALVKAAEEWNDAQWASPDRPQPAAIARREIPAFYQLAANRWGLVSEDDIDAFFDKQVAVIEYNIGIGMPRTVADKRINEINRHRKSLQEVYRERDSAFTKWRISSGYKASCEELDRLCDIEDNLGEKILNYRCESIEDARLKAAHLKRSCLHITNETAQALLQSFLA